MTDKSQFKCRVFYVSSLYFSIIVFHILGYGLKEGRPMSNFFLNLIWICNILLILHFTEIKQYKCMLHNLPWIVFIFLSKHRNRTKNNNKNEKQIPNYTLINYILFCNGCQFAKNALTFSQMNSFLEKNLEFGIFIILIQKQKQDWWQKVWSWNDLYI